MGKQRYTLNQVIQNFLNWVTKETQFKASNQETKNWVTKETQFKASNQETKNWATKDTKFKQEIKNSLN